MTDPHAAEAGFLADILADPDEDAVRLIYADWLDDHGQSERAEFIRVQIRLVGHPVHHTVDTGCPLRKREEELFRENIQGWLPIPGYVWWTECNDGAWACVGGTEVDPSEKKPHYSAGFRRGFVEEIADIPAEDWRAYADRLTAAHPIREVRLTTWPGRAVSLHDPAMTAWTMSPEWMDGGIVCAMHERTLFARRALADRWPRITFHLPND